MSDPLTLVGILVDERDHKAPDVQEVITRYGSNIICRMGVPSPSKEKGLITLVFDGSSEKMDVFREDLTSLPGVTVGTIGFEQ